MQVLLYDGLCGFCDRTVQFILARDPGGSMMFAPLQGEFAAGILRQRPELREVDSLILVETVMARVDPRVSVRSAAVLAIADYLGGPWRAATIAEAGAIRPCATGAMTSSRATATACSGATTRARFPMPEQRARFVP